MKKIPLLLPLFFASKLALANNPQDYRSFLKCKEVSESLMHLTIVPKQSLSCRLELTKLATGAYVAGEMIHYHARKIAKQTLQKEILDIDSQEKKNCLGNFMVTRAKLDLISVEGQL